MQMKNLQILKQSNRLGWTRKQLFGMAPKHQISNHHVPMQRAAACKLHHIPFACPRCFHRRAYHLFPPESGDVTILTGSKAGFSEHLSQGKCYLAARCTLNRSDR